MQLVNLRSYWVLGVIDPVTGVLIRKGEDAQTQTQRKDSHMMMEAEAGGMWPPAGEQQGQGRLEEKDSSLGPSEGSCPARTLILDFWPPEPGESTFLGLSTPQFVVAPGS